ncbi:glycosyltransferase [Gammaproteobacteria bacterium]|nr:glycosyltransferase [Gammaproteobacteria bacterium]
MRISIITVTYNSEKTIRTTLDSVAKQTWHDIEHIVIDGKSSDRTLEIVKEFPHISKVISEEDAGIYDAMNKGIKESSGDVLGFLNSDDWYYTNSIVEGICNGFGSKSIDAVYGDLVFVKNEIDTKPLRIWVSKPYKDKDFLSGWVPPHPTFYAKKSIYERYGLFNSDLMFAADFDIMCRFIEKERIETNYLPGYMVNMRLGGATTKNIINILKGNIEILISLRANGFKPSLYFIIQKILGKLKQLNTSRLKNER